MVATTRAHLATCIPRLPAVPYSSHIAAQSLPEAAAYAATGALLSLTRWRFVRAALRVVAPPLLRGAGVLTRDEGRYRDSIQALRVKKTFVAYGSGAGGGKQEQRAIELQASGKLAGL